MLIFFRENLSLNINFALLYAFSLDFIGGRFIKQLQ